MSSGAPTFKAINFDSIKKAVKEVTTEQNIPKLTYPTEAASPTPASIPAPATPDVVPAKRAPRKAGGPARVIRTAVDLPDYLLKALAKESVEKGVTKRYLYLSAFRAAGFTINDIDMQEDGRRESAA